MPAEEQVDLDPAAPLVPSFEVFFRANYGTLVRLLSAAADDAEDAVQDAFLQAHIHWLKVARYEDPRAWVRLVAVRKLLNRQRGRSRGSRAVERLRASAASGDWSVELPSTSALVAEVRRLPPRQRMAVALFYLCDLPLSDVATTMGISLGAVKATLAVSRKTLRLYLENDDDA
jgi:RNA polymerase sigma-70 factor (ECF subfamily)